MSKVTQLNHPFNITQISLLEVKIQVLSILEN